MGRKVEETMLHLACKWAGTQGAARVSAQLKETPKNKPCRTFFQNSGFRVLDGNSFEWDASQEYPRPAPITLHWTSA